MIHSIVVIIGVSILIFMISRIIPGDPARMALGANTPQWVVDRLRVEMNLDKPIHIQYFLWFKGILRGDLGTSLYTKRPVLEDIVEFFPATLELMLFSGIIMGLGGLFLGILSAKYNDSWIDNIVRIFSYAGIVTPSFVFAIIFMLFFCYILPIFPPTGRLSRNIIMANPITNLIIVDSLLQGNFTAFFDALKHIILPAFSLALGGLSQQARILRSSLLDNISKDYILAHESYGISKKTIWYKYLLKSSIIPEITVFGLDFATLFGHAFLVEMVFSWPGLSSYGINVMLQKDLNAISAVIIIFGIIIVTMNIIVDLIIASLDPRIRLGTV